MSSQPSPGTMPAVLIIVMVAAAILAIFGSYMMLAQKAGGGEVAFIRACVLPDDPTDVDCRAKSAIKDKWDIDIDQMIEQRRVLMVATVRRMINGELLKRDVYESCIAVRECAPVPLLPDYVDSAALASTHAYLDTRKAFWQLAEDSPLTPEICTFMDICRAMRAAGVVTIQ